jgi:hypothetical protein
VPKTAKLDINNPSQIVDKIAFEQRKIASASLFHSDFRKNTNCAIITYIDYYESKATILTENTETKTPQSPVTDETDNRPWYWIPFKLCLACLTL